MSYRVLRPVYEKTGEVTNTTEGTIHWQRVVSWQELGIAQDMEDAYEKFPRGRKNGYSHVLEEVKVH